MSFVPKIETALHQQASRTAPVNLLTVVVPTRNRPHGLLGQLRLFETCHPVTVVVADSSDPEQAAAVRAAAQGRADYRTYAPELTLYDKLAEAVATVETPFVLLVSDRKI